MRYTVWGSFSQRSGLLIQLEDTHLLQIKAPGDGHDVFWETTMESVIQDYRTVEGVNIAHSGRTCVSLFRFGEDSRGHMRTRMEEIWSLEEVDFNIKGLSIDCFLPPADLEREDEDEDEDAKNNNGGLLPSRNRILGSKGGRKIVAIHEEDSLEMFAVDDEMYCD
ncbi:hypothetical protein SASPL_123471 [Salvia splendens]|uniref:Uncharacterized protein n=2 Tax=Salvia splendens TaxID=180675 RepID=A0A8X8XP52_SALSN|nr:hypothetical protein SASPL_123471 [Salvia splendens]